MASPILESLASTSFSPQLQVDVDENFRVEVFKYLYLKLTSSFAFVNDTCSNIDLHSGPMCVKHIFSNELLENSKDIENEEFLEWYIDTKDNKFMKRGYFFKIVIVPNAASDNAHLILKHCPMDNEILSYTTIKRVVDIPQDIFKLIKSVYIDEWKLYSMVVLRKQIDTEDVHIDLDQIYDAFGESYYVQSVKASSMKSINNFLSDYSDHKVIYSKIYHTIKTNDNFLNLPDVLIPNGYELYDTKYYYLIANKDQFPDYCLKISDEKKKEIEDSEKGILEASQEWEAATGLKNLCLF